MRVTRLLGTTLREASTQHPLSAFSVLIRAGYIRESKNGALTYLDLGQKTIERIFSRFKIIVGMFEASEVLLPDSSLLADEQLIQLAVSEISSYKQLPNYSYQFDQKTGEFTFWILTDNEISDQSFSSVLGQSFFGMVEQNAVPMVKVDHLNRSAGISRDFFFINPNGKDSFLQAGEEMASLGSAVIRKNSTKPSPKLPLKEVHTPNTSTILALAEYLDIAESQTAKVVFYSAQLIGDQTNKLVIAVVRGDREVSETKVAAHTGARSLRPATDSEILAVGCVPGFASPVGIDHKDVFVIVDDEVVRTPNLVAGANRKDHHLMNVCYERDFKAKLVVDIVQAKEGQLSRNGSPWERKRGVKIGSYSALGSRFAAAHKATFMGMFGQSEPFILSKFTFNFRQLMLAMAEHRQDENGLVWNSMAAPYSVILITLEKNPDPEGFTERFYSQLVVAGIPTLFDDRPKKMASPGVKFKDADLRGIPIRITVSEKTLAENNVELKLRTEQESRRVPTEGLLEFVKETIRKI